MLKKNAIKNFFKKNGLYVCLGVCVLGIAAGIVFGNADSGEKVAEPPKAKTESTADIKKTAAAPSPSPSAAVPSSPSLTPEPSPTKTAKSETNAVSGNKLRLKMPLDGEIIRAFSGDTLVYNSNLNMWLTHNGVDIASTSTDEVVCALPGEVVSVSSDDTRAVTVTVRHTGDYSTVYSGLSEAGVEAGALVNAGTRIGRAGTAPFEADLGAHLHFELLKNEEYIDAGKYFIDEKK